MFLRACRRLNPHLSGKSKGKEGSPWALGGGREPMHEHRRTDLTSARRAFRWCAGLMMLGAVLLGGVAPSQAATVHHTVASTLQQGHTFMQPGCDTGWNGT